MHRLLVALAAVLLTACSSGGDPSSEPTSSPSSISFSHGNVLIDTERGSVIVSTEIADSEEQREHGLMGRTSLGDDEGMIFIFMEPSTGGFYMKDTLIPLSIAFIDEGGKIIAITDMDPCHSDPCPIYRSPSEYSAALEVNQGAFEAWGVAVGDRVTLTRS